MYEMDDIEHPEDGIYIRQVTDAETKPKWVCIACVWAFLSVHPKILLIFLNSWIALLMPVDSAAWQ